MIKGGGGGERVAKQCSTRIKKKGGRGGFGQLLSCWSVHCTHFIEGLLSFDVYTWKEGGCSGQEVLHPPSLLWGKQLKHSYQSYLVRERQVDSGKSVCIKSPVVFRGSLSIVGFLSFSPFTSCHTHTSAVSFSL